MLSKEKDVMIGKKLRQIRNMMGISQSSLANEVGVTFQQVQKYEKGVNRISSGRLHDFAQILNINVQDFYDEIDSEFSGKVSSFAEKDNSEFIKKDVFSSKETVNLVREYYKIKDTAKRKNILEIIKAMSEG